MKHVDVVWNEEPRRVDGLQLPDVVCAGEVFNWSRASQDVLRRKRRDGRPKPTADQITDRLLHGDLPDSIERIARELKTDCKKVRAVVQDLKRDGLLTESSFPKHFLLRIKI